MSELLKKYDSWLQDDGPAALVIREHLMPVEGHDGVIFPATFAAEGKKNSAYNIDEFSDGTNVCLIDSVGSQANRIEPMFINDPYAKLVPQIIIKAGDTNKNLLVIGHRAGDAFIRCSSLHEELNADFKALQNGDAEPLAKIAPTSLVFGAWDSRDTQAKLPRLINSTIRAFNVKKLTRSAQYISTVNYINMGLLDEPTTKKTKDAYAKQGFVHVPATGTHGGIIAEGGVRRDAIMNLAALRLLRVGKDNAKTTSLRRYILSLAFVAFTLPSSGYLRQGCNLVLDPEKSNELLKVYYNGKREQIILSHTEAIEFAKVAAGDFGVGENRSIDFEQRLAKEAVEKALKNKDDNSND